jgi:hypothetical protein
LGVHMLVSWDHQHHWSDHRPILPRLLLNQTSPEELSNAFMIIHCCNLRHICIISVYHIHPYSSKHLH